LFCQRNRHGSIYTGDWYDGIAATQRWQCEACQNLTIVVRSAVDQCYSAQAGKRYTKGIDRARIPHADPSHDHKRCNMGRIEPRRPCRLPNMLNNKLSLLLCLPRHFVFFLNVVCGADQLHLTILASFTMTTLFPETQLRRCMAGPGNKLAMSDTELHSCGDGPN
jgi:hypothetical protein